MAATVPGMGDGLVQARGLRKSFGSFEAVKGVDVDVAPGEVFGFLGPNGAGKSSTMRMIACVSPRSGGTLQVLGMDPDVDGPRIRARIGVVPQLDNLDPDFTVRENLLVFGRYFDIPRAALESRIPSLLEFAGLTGREQARIQTLSGGMKRRLTLARALVNDPQLIFLDEPTTGLDPQARHLIWERMRRLTNEGRTILLTTHFMDEAERLCDRVAILDRGRKIAEGAPRELIALHIEPQVVEVYGDGALDWAERYGKNAAERCERTGETVFCYTHNADELTHALEREERVRYLPRPANLEDVFLKLTGRELRD